MNAATIEIHPATEPRAFRREHRYAHGANGGAVDLTVTRDDRGSGITVRWNVNRGRGWAKGWRVGKANEIEAFSFAETKWPALVAWLEALEPLESLGAAAAFSAQIASMRGAS